MGTRHLIAVKSDGEYKVAQYGQWDGYLEGCGKKVLEFLKQNFKYDNFKERLNNCRFLSDSEVEKIDAEISRAGIKMSSVYPTLDRDTSYLILDIINNSTSEVVLENNITFADDSLFCEWAYVIDLDTNTFEIFKGFNEEAMDTSERFYSEERVHRTYYPVTLLETYSLDELPSEEELLDLDEEE